MVPSRVVWGHPLDRTVSCDLLVLEHQIDGIVSCDHVVLEHPFDGIVSCDHVVWEHPLDGSVSRDLVVPARSPAPPHYILEESNFDFRYVRLCDSDIASNMVVFVWVESVLSPNKRTRRLTVIC